LWTPTGFHSTGNILIQAESHGTSIIFYGNDLNAKLGTHDVGVASQGYRKFSYHLSLTRPTLLRTF
jgi:hypothetical protein